MTNEEGSVRRPAFSRSTTALTIARGIARHHGGDIEATPPGPGRGSAFTVVLPLRAD